MLNKEPNNRQHGRDGTSDPTTEIQYFLVADSQIQPLSHVSVIETLCFRVQGGRGDESVLFIRREV